MNAGGLPFDDEFPLQFAEVIGDHALTDSMRKAIIWASIQRFLDETEQNTIDTEEFSQTEITMSKYVQFHGPFNDVDEAFEESKKRIGVLVAPRHMWTGDDEFVFLAVLAN
ncbi:MAG: hypothetical protein EBS53_00200 [Bacteroidetes bacterium]|jgi:hypothetical protein|nr:hypothetical protein [Bacteroidota bacterium]